MTKHNLFAALFLICLIFIMAGAFNYGFSRYYWAIPFMIGAYLISKKVFKNKHFIRGTLIFCALSIIFNHTLESNPLIFPIIKDGTVTIKKDGYLITYPSGLQSFTEKEPDKSKIIASGRTYAYKPLYKGEVYKVTGVKVTGLNELKVITDGGQFSTLNTTAIEFNKPAYNKYAAKFSDLMIHVPAIIFGPIFLLLH